MNKKKPMNYISKKKYSRICKIVNIVQYSKISKILFKTK